jgi:hypothetical protein
MTIRFRCEACNKTVEAPDSAAGKQGKCPYCGHSCYIAAPVQDEDLIPLSPMDDDGPTRTEDELKELERQLLHEMSGEPDVPLEHKDDLKSEDLHHLVVNYVMDLYGGNIERADAVAQKLKMFKFTAIEAAQDFQRGKVTEDALKAVPPRVLKGFLAALVEKLRG